jgi:hypothetical protein
MINLKKIFDPEELLSVGNMFKIDERSNQLWK